MTRSREYLSQTQLDFEVERMLDELQGDRNNAKGYNNGGKEDKEELGELFLCTTKESNVDLPYNPV